MKVTKTDLLASTMSIILMIGVTGYILVDAIYTYNQQSKEHHKLHHELIKENYRLNEWYQNWSNNTDCDTFRQPTSVSIKCEKYEL